MYRKHFIFLKDWLAQVELALDKTDEPVLPHRDELMSFCKRMNNKFCKATFEQELIKKKAELKGSTFYG